MNEARKLALTALVLLAIGLAAYSVELLKDAGRRWLALIVTSLILLILALGIHYSHAHDAHRPDLNGWFDGLASKRGPCCSNADGTAVVDADWESRGGHYRVRIKGEWVDVPDDAVINEPNRDGRTIVWPLIGRTDAEGYWKPGVNIRCFMPGSMG